MTDATRTEPSVSRAGRAGFTLAELLVVITIVTISATLILPVVVNLARTQRVDSGVRSVQALLHGARSMAAARRQVYGCQVFLESTPGAEVDVRRFGLLLTDQDGNPAERQEPEFLPERLDVHLYAGSNPTPLGTPVTIRFMPDGTLDPALPAPFRILLVNGGDVNDSEDLIIRRTGVIEVREPGE